MIAPTSHPSRLLKMMAGLARWSLGLLLAFWLLLAIAWGALHGLIVPRIGEFRPQLQAHATKVLGVPVQIGAIEARTDSLVPSVELLDVALLDAGGRVALRLPRVVVAVSPRSLVNWNAEQIYIEEPVLDVRRTADGRIEVAGLEFAQSGGDSNAAADWVFSQGEVFIKGGTLRWTDEQRGAPELALTDVNLVLRNGNWRHHMRLDATPPPDWGDRFTLAGLFRAPLLRARDGNWKHWNGQVFADFARVDVSQLHRHAQIDGVNVAEGRGALRAWADFQRGELMGGTADLALADVNATLGKDLQALELHAVQGRLGGRRLAGGFELFTQGLQFQTRDGLNWPGGNVRLVHTDASGKLPAQGDFRADRLDLAALAQIGARLPLSAAAHHALTTYAPRGLVDEVSATWRGPVDALQAYQLRGRVRGLSLAAEHTGSAPVHFGLRGATVDIDMTQAGGKAALSISSGALVLPGVFEDPVLPLDRLSADVRWQIEGERIAVQAADVQFANADAQGEARATWHTSDAAKAPHRSRFPGVLDLSGNLNRADGTRVHRYLPLSIPAESRHYVRDAVVAGTASNVQFRVKGDLHDLPFNDPRQGEFRIAARVRDVTYAYVPPQLQPANTLPWPALTELGGELIFERSSMQVRGASGSFAGRPGLRLSRVDARIPDLSHTVVGVDADARGPLPELLALMSSSPLGGMTSNALDQATGTGNADFKLRLSLPISDMAKSKVQGSVVLAGNEVRITPDTPPLTRARGTVQFSESGFSLTNMQAQALGGPVRLEGGMRALPPNAPATESAVQLRAQGTATAEGLQQATQLGMLAQLARRASGSAPYSMTLGFRRGVPEIQVTTSLQGMALALPAPLAKTAGTSTPLRFENQVLRESLTGLASATAAGTAGLPPLRDQITLDLGAIGSATYVRELSGGQARVLRGTIGIGLGEGESAPMPVQGVAANIQQGKVDVDTWEDVLTQATTGAAGTGASTPANAAPPGLATASTGITGNAQDYLPTTLALRARELTLQGRTLHNVVAGALRNGTTWRATLDASELSGFLEFRQPGAADHPSGLLYARLSRASLPQSDANQVEALLDDQPGTLPALDIVVDDFELRAKRLGRVEIQAQNRGSEGVQREWRLTRFNILSPEANLTASGNWAVVAGSAGAAAARPSERRTVLNFKLDIRDSGDLLGRMGMANVVRRGKGRMEGQVAWMGAPFSPDYRSMTGEINLNVESGQFLKADPGLAKLLGVLSLQSLPRRLALDFRDVFSEGFAFDFVRGDVRIEQGVATTNNLQMKGVNAAVLMEGSANIEAETQDLRVVVVPEINAMTASLVATAINPVIGLGSFLAQVFLRGPLIEAATQEFRIDGTWTDPRVVRVPRRARDATAPAPGQAAPAAAPAPAPKTGEPS
ncbi:MAG: YhdP family protein [Acidovorax sp.]|uniref:YhdP family protein n=1 Tax=Acidovorax sp. TaxID=1872122 RepID=UPI002625B79E|nr:YhdP family protein [Acidovorax sp.]MDH4465502.1 YhdP family protein [Acidovorax sp.]